MFRQLFASMNELLENIIQQYPSAVGDRKDDLDQQLKILQAMSETCIEEWLLFEEKWSAWHEKVQIGFYEVTDVLLSDEMKETFQKGQGYFKLYMFDKAIDVLEHVIHARPDFLMARLYLALGYLHLNELAESHRHFQFILPQADSSKIKAISLNALGCIQAKMSNMEKAIDYFQEAFRADPTLPDPLVNMNVCLYNEGTLQCGMGAIP